MKWKQLFAAADDYLAVCSWKDIALLKFCLLALGLLAGMLVPKNRRPAFAAGAGAVFLATYIPLMAKFLPLLTHAWAEAEED